jgi:hypothetical protein
VEPSPVDYLAHYLSKDLTRKIATNTIEHKLPLQSEAVVEALFHIRSILESSGRRTTRATRLGG